MHYSLDKKEDLSSRIDELERQVETLSDDNIRYRRTMEDMLYNLTLENMPTVKAALEATAVTPSLVTGYLYSGNARIADITCLRLRTDYDKPARYLLSDTSPLRYLYIHDSVCEFITATVVAPEGTSTQTPTEQYRNADGAAVYWSDAAHSSMTTEETEFPVTVYRYRESVDMDFSLEEYLKTVAEDVVPEDGTSDGTSADGTSEGASGDTSGDATEGEEATELVITSERSSAPSLSVGDGRIDSRGDRLNIFLPPDTSDDGMRRCARISLERGGVTDATHRRVSIGLSEGDGTISIAPEGCDKKRSSLIGGTVGYDIKTETDTASGALKLIYPDGGEFSFTVTPPDGGSEWSRRELLTAAVGISVGVPWTDTRPSFVFRINVKRTSYSFSTSSSAYPLLYDGCLTVDWGDGVREDFRDGVDPTHVYAEKGEYTVIYRGCIKRMRFVSNTVLTEVISALPYTMTEGFDSCFLRCTSLTSIPEDLFENVKITAANGLYATFRQSNITSIPERLFDACSYLTHFQYTFWGCRKNTTIPERLFASVADAENLYGTFCGNTSFKGKLPELWNRFPDAVGSGCFGACSGALNYSAVPTEWRRSVT